MIYRPYGTCVKCAINSTYINVPSRTWVVVGHERPRSTRVIVSKFIDDGLGYVGIRKHEMKINDQSASR